MKLITKLFGKKELTEKERREIYMKNYINSEIKPTIKEMSQNNLNVTKRVLPILRDINNVEDLENLEKIMLAYYKAVKEVEYKNRDISQKEIEGHTDKVVYDTGYLFVTYVGRDCSEDEEDIKKYQHGSLAEGTVYAGAPCTGGTYYAVNNMLSKLTSCEENKPRNSYYPGSLDKENIDKKFERKKNGTN